MSETAEATPATTPAPAAPRLARDARYYDTKREIGQYVSNQARSRDLRSDDDFKSAEGYRGKTNKLLWGVLILTISLVFLTLVETFEGALQMASFGVGLLLGVGGIVFSIMMEVAKYE